MVYLSRGKTEGMADDGQNNSFMNDSLELSGGGRKSSPAASVAVAPEDKNGDTDYFAFSEEEEDGLYLGLFPQYVVNLLQDKSNWKNRASGIGKIQSVISDLRDSSVLESNLALVVELVTAPLSDPHFKVAQTGLELVGCLVVKIGRSISPYLPTLVLGILVKMGSNKFVIKQAGMRVLMQLMLNIGSEKVVSEVLNSGLHHKTSRVREESINVIIAALLTFPRTNFHLFMLVRELIPSMADQKQKVRQASLEAIALLCHLMDPSDLKQVVAAVANIERTSEKVVAMEEGGGNTMMEALHARMSRHLLPQLNADGLVDHAVPVASAKAPHSYSGRDVDWILANGGTKSSGGGQQQQARKPSLAQSSEQSSFRPYRSAGKKLPWEKDSPDEPMPVTTVSNMVNGQSNGIRTTPLRQELPLPPSLRLHPSPKHLGAVGQVPSPYAGTSPYAVSTPKRSSHGRNYADIHLTKLQQSSSTTNQIGVSTSSSFRGGLRGSGRDPFFVQRNSNPSLGSTLPPGLPTGVPPGTRRHCSLPDALVVQSEATGDGHYVPMHAPHEVRGDVMMTSLNSPIGSAGMSVTWPKAQGTPLTALRGSQQISADSSAVVGKVQGSVRTSMSRPPSKPRVRNPLTLLKHHTANGGGSPQHSPTQIEREFLAGGGGGAPWCAEGWDEEYYDMIPEDTAILDNSLSSSLSSLCAPTKNGEIDKLKHIRKQAASRKAQLLSATNSMSNSISNSPDLSGTPPLRQHSGERQNGGLTEKLSSISAPSRKPKDKVTFSLTQPPTRRWNSDAGIKLDSLDLDLNRTYTVGSDESTAQHNEGGSDLKEGGSDLKSVYTSSAPLALKKPSKAKSIKRNTHLEEPDAPTPETITLEGRSFDRGEAEKETQPKKKARKAEPPRGNAPSKPRAVRLNSFGLEGQRPSIERGGTNTIEMEISGMASLRGADGASNVPSLSQATKESIVRKRQKQLGERDSPKTYSGTYTSSKPPLPPQPMDVSAPPQHVHQRKERDSQVHHAESGYVTSGDETPKSQRGRRNSMDGVESTVRNGSPLEELYPFGNPEKALREALKDLTDSDDWSRKCDGMLAVRRVAMCHLDVLSPQLHPVVLAVQKEVKNLRSQVARGAIACLGDLFAITGKAMEHKDLEGVVRTLQHKGGESNTFIREDVEKALTEMISNVSLGRSLQAIISGGLAHRNVQVRKMTSRLICLSVEWYGPGKLLHASKEVLERTLTAVVQLIGDNAPETRYYARKCLHQLWPEPEFDHVASRVLSAQLMGKLREAIEYLKAKGIGDPPSEMQSVKHNGSSNSSRHSTGGTIRVSTNGTPSGRKTTADQGPDSHSTAATATREGYSKRSKKYSSLQNSFSAEVPLPEGLCERLKASDWSERHEAISELEEFVNVYPTALGPHLVKVFDAFSPRLTDRNSKVNLRALQAFSNMVSLLGNTLIPVVNSVVTTLVPNLASRNSTIHSTALVVLDLLSQCVDAVHLLQPFANIGQYGNSRVQPIVIKKLAEVAKLAYDQKPHMVTRQVLPVMWHLLTAKTPATGDSKAAISALCEALYSCMGQDLLYSASNLSTEHQHKLQELISSFNR